MHFSIQNTDDWSDIGRKIKEGPKADFNTDPARGEPIVSCIEGSNSTNGGGIRWILYEG